VIEERKSGDVVVLSVGRRLKGESETALRDRVDELVQQGRRNVLIDLKACPEIDSSELGRLVRCHLSLRQAGGRVRLCNLSPRVMTLMRMSKLDTVMDLFETEEQALAAIESRRTGCGQVPSAGMNLLGAKEKQA
jgi:anti-sigma B factor antagonist